MKNYKYDKKRAIASFAEFELVIMNDAVEYAQQKEDDPIMKIDVNKFYEHCYRKFFKMLVERNVKFLKLDSHFILYSLQIKFASAMNNFSLYDVEKIKLLQLTKTFIKEYEDYLNK